MKRLSILLACMLLTVVGVFAKDQFAAPPVGIVEKLGNQVPLHAELYDENGILVPLDSIINKPTILMFVYFRCPGICSPLLTEVTQVVKKMGLELGKDYEIVTISFDPSEKSDLAREKRQNYLGSFEDPVNPAGWRFLTGDSATIHAVTDAAGFYYQRDGRDWIHAGALIILSPQGKVVRYLYGIQHLPLDVKLALVEASEGRVGPTIAKILAFCYSYDPEGKTYAFNITRVAGLAIVAIVAVFVVVVLVRPKNKKAERHDTNDRSGDGTTRA